MSPPYFFRDTIKRQIRHNSESGWIINHEANQMCSISGLRDFFLLPFSMQIADNEKKHSFQGHARVSK